MAKRKNARAKKGALAAAATENATPSVSFNVLADPNLGSVRDVPQQTHVPDAPHPTPAPAAEHQAPMSKEETLCAAIDGEVESRAASIRDLTAAHLAAFSAAWDLELSKLTVEEQSMPFEKFLKLHPGRIAEDIENLLKGGGTSSLISYTEGKDRKPLLDRSSKWNTSSLVTPGAGVSTLGQPLPKEDKDRASEQVSERVLEMRSWYEKHCMRLQNFSQTPSMRGQGNLGTPGIFNLPGQIPSGGHGGLFTPMGGTTLGTTPKTVRLPKHGETLLSINGSPLGQFGKTPRTTGTGRITRTNSRLAASKRNFRDL